MSQDQAQKATAPDFAELSTHIATIAARSQRLLGTFMARSDIMKDKLSGSDPAHVGQAFNSFIQKTLSDPRLLVDQQISFWQDYVKLLQNTVAQAGGQKVEAIIAPEKGDKRFSDPAWEEMWVFNFIKQSYLLFARWAHEMIGQLEGLDPKAAHKVRFYTNQIVDAMAPTNFWLSNPEVLRTTIETKGENLLKGLENLLKDMERGHGELLISMSDMAAFRFGENIATTKGKVVFQNDLFQLIQYAPLTEKVHKTPLLIVPPWINKFYILDLKADNSFIRYLVEQGHTVFCMSWVNATEKHATLGFDDYMMMGPLTAMQEIVKITGEKDLNCIAYCIGGTLMSSTLAWLAAAGDKKPSGLPEISSITYLTTLVDFSDAGDIAVFIDEDQISMLEKTMEQKGYLPGTALAMTFSMLRANDLIWSFVVNNYLLGKDPFPFDLLAWNSDSTNMPATMHSYYLRNMYLENNLIKPEKLVLKGVPIDVRRNKVPAFLLSTVEDHIAPWKTTYTATQLYSGPVTFCLSGSGHIAGVVNPPAKKKYCHWTGKEGEFPANPNDWFKSATKNDGSWWPHWAEWIKPKAGDMVPARDPAKGNVIEEAPGSYVRVRIV